MIAVVCATPEEFAALLAHVDAPHEVELAGFLARQGSYDGQPVVLARSGIGKVNAAILATLLLARGNCRAMVFSGVAGGLAEDLPVGSVLLAERMATHDYGIVSAGRFTRVETGVIPIGAPELTQPRALPPETVTVLERLRDRVAPLLGHPIRLGTILTGDIFLNCASTRDALRAALAGDAIDMESDAVAQAADRFGVPAYVIRTVSDRAGEDSHTSYTEMAAMAAHNSALCVRELLAMLREDAAQR
ncbi:5'-methylthioadenosine/S-adenosylhomocysteine nucleosidase [Alsobacter sp. SYSU M60028]|uniref:adenosylhomocysteine nucleosidase n=1 Tax=Alsobacter ponti TaxID=2962936 RepID=A0ABT1LFB4_9HYPH|nr:5'-methylthioadenosine/S-adenosylhomocysteine nucleosidase [Alsobacter ponti]MCP8940185.1 5'-methylthioadenosine/S-adenosylhomocysteine nucleosidase [Alsobacter ponti]